MSTTALILVALSAFMHAGWNLLCKKNHPTTGFFLIASLAGTLLLVPVLVPSSGLLREIPFLAWAAIVSTGFFLALNYAAIAGAYRAGDISVAYPLARSVPLLFVPMLGFLLGRGSQISTQGIAGMLLVAGSCFFIPLHRFRDFHFRSFMNATCFLALLAAIGTTGYCMIDDEALRLLRSQPSIHAGNLKITLVYALLENTSATLWLALFMLFQSQERNKLRETCKSQWRPASLAGVVISATYLVVLLAMAFARDVSYIVGFRQLSIPIGAVAGMLILKEKPHPPKLAGIAVLLVGLLFIAWG